jgi:DMSO/TMAO reductase YedYZ molybdopterin-dependent catalytic subunit
MSITWNLAAWLRGFNAVVLITVLGLLARLLLGLPFPLQELFNRLTQFLGTPQMFQIIHRFLGYGAGGKVFAFAGSLGLWLVLLSGLGIFSPVVATVALLLVCWWLVPFWVAIPTALVYLGIRVLLEAKGMVFSDSRRSSLKWLSLGSGTLVFGGTAALVRTLFPSSTITNAVVRNAKLPSGITPQSEFYSISKNLEAFDPKLEAKNWQLEIKGLVKSKKSYRLEDLKARPVRDLEATMVCISNAVGGGLIGNAIWTGFSLSDLLLEAGIEKEARFLLWKAADGYTESLPLQAALEQDVMLVYAMNYEPLSQKHGFPLRVIIPGRLGMKQPRWITTIELSETDQTGYWVERGWSKDAYAQTMSRIDSPSENAGFLKADGIKEISGIAFAGNNTITRVEVSSDGGLVWRDAELLPRRSQYAWTQWRIAWTPQSGPHQLVVRAYADGVLQPETERDALPEASSGWHKFISNLS